MKNSNGKEKKQPFLKKRRKLFQEFSLSCLEKDGFRGIVRVQKNVYNRRSFLHEDF